MKFCEVTTFGEPTMVDYIFECGVPVITIIFMIILILTTFVMWIYIIIHTIKNN